LTLLFILLSSFFENKTVLNQGDPLSPILFNLTLQKVTQSIKKVPSVIKIGQEQLNILAYADDIALIGKNELEIRKRFVEMENIARKFGLRINHEKTKYMIVERKDSFKEKENRTFENKKSTNFKEWKILNI